MSSLLRASERWFRLLERLYPADFRDATGGALVEAYQDRARHALERGGGMRLAALWLRALLDSLRNGPAERLRPAAAWRRSGDWGRDLERAGRRLRRSPWFAATTIGTLTVGLGMFAVAYTAVRKVLLDPLPYRNSADLYYMWRDNGAALKRSALAGPDIAELQKSNSVVQKATIKPARRLRRR